jgi:hypothetical protein
MFFSLLNVNAKSSFAEFIGCPIFLGVPPAFKSTEKMSKPPNPVIPFEEKQNIVIRYEWEIFIPAVLIEFPKFSGCRKCHQHLQLL